jgi:hypothetical protein
MGIHAGRLSLGEQSNGSVDDPAVDCLDLAEVLRDIQKDTGRDRFAVISEHAEQDLATVRLAVRDWDDWLFPQLEAVGVKRVPGCVAAR